MLLEPISGKRNKTSKEKKQVTAKNNSEGFVAEKYNSTENKQTKKEKLDKKQHVKNYRPNKQKDKYQLNLHVSIGSSPWFHR